MSWKVAIASSLAVIVGVALGELICCSPAGRDAIGRLCGRGRLLALAEHEGIYEADVEGATAEFLYRKGQDDPASDVSGRFAKTIRETLARTVVARRRAVRVDVPGSRITRGLDLLRNQFRDRKDWKASLRANELSERSLRKMIAGDLQSLTWISRQISPQLKVTVEECREFYQQHPGKYVLPERLRVSHLFLAAPPQTAPEIVDLKKQKMESIAKRMRNGEDFAALVASDSEDEATKTRGGDLGYLAAYRMPADFFQAAMKLRPGQISLPVRTSLGFHIIQAVDTKPARPLTFEEVSSEIGVQLEKQKRREAVRKLDVDLNASVRLMAQSPSGF